MILISQGTPDQKSSTALTRPVPGVPGVPVKDDAPDPIDNGVRNSGPQIEELCEQLEIAGKDIDRLQEEAEDMEEQIAKFEASLQQLPDDIADVVQQLLDGSPDSVLRSRIEGLVTTLRREAKKPAGTEGLNVSLLVWTSIAHCPRVA